MKHMRLFTLLIAFIALLPLSAEKIGDEVTIEVTIRGKTESKKMKLRAFSEYDKNGNMIYNEYNYNEYNEEGRNWDKTEYDARGNKIYSINSAGIEVWYEYKYDSVGNLVYEKETSKGWKKPTEWYYTYDSRGNKTSAKMAGFAETKYVYDSDDNLIYEGSTTNFSIADTGTWYQYDENGNKIYSKTVYSSGGEPFERWYKYDSSGRLVQEDSNRGDVSIYEYDSFGVGKDVHKKTKYNGSWSEVWYGYEKNGVLQYQLWDTGYIDWYEYTFWGNGKVKTRKSYGLVW